MKNTIIRIFLLGILSAFIANCERAQPDSSTVSLQLPSYNKVSSLTCTKCLKAVFVNVNGDFPTIKFNAFVPNFDNPTSELNPQVVIDVPSGPARKIQVLGVYGLTDGTLEVQYGSVVADIAGATPPPISLTLTNYGPFKGGNIAGRYLTGVDSGPTGRVTISVTEPNSGVNMDLFDSQMLNGWFNFFISENFPMSYRMADGTPLGGFQNIDLNNMTPASTDHTRARFYRPAPVYTLRGTTWNLENEHNDVLYGFFGDATLAASKYVCVEESAGFSFTNLSSNGISADLTYSYPATSGAVHGIGGIGYSSAGTNCSSADTTQYSLNRINIHPQQFDGMGNDTATSLQSVFSFVRNGTAVQKSIITASTATTFQFQILPGIYPTIFDGMKVFIKSSIGNAGYDFIPCEDAWMVQNGFTEFTNFATAPSIVSDVLTFSIQTSTVLNMQSLNVGAIVCPTHQGLMTGIGGFFLGPL